MRAHVYANMRVDPRLVEYYTRGVERTRLHAGAGMLEFERTKEILLPHLPAPPATILDVGGATGVYARWLAELGHCVHVVDAVPMHVDHASSLPGVTAELGDARALSQPDVSFDAVLEFGPLYHLLERDDRVAAIREAGRVVRPDGVVALAYIGRWAGVIDGLVDGWIYDGDSMARVEQQLVDGSVRVANEDKNPGFGGISYFHHPDEVRGEISDAGLEPVDVCGVEGPGWILPDIEQRWSSDEHREIVLRAARATAHDPVMIALSCHLLAIARR